MFPSLTASSSPTPPCPHVRGDVSVPAGAVMPFANLSPRTWGCFRYVINEPPAASLVPTYVGMFPKRPRGSFSGAACPHVRGDVSSKVTLRFDPAPLSPRTWGCFWPFMGAAFAAPLVPTYVGMFPGMSSCFWAREPCPHVRGDVSSTGSGAELQAVLVPTYVGMFPWRRRIRRPPCSCPHVRGDVSFSTDACAAIISLSPRTWGCFYRGFLMSPIGKLVPTYVGMFPDGSAPCRPRATCPHVRGDVSKGLAFTFKNLNLSPRTWGCFYARPIFFSASALVPTYVGMFPKLSHKYVNFQQTGNEQLFFCGNIFLFGSCCLSFCSTFLAN